MNRNRSQSDLRPAILFLLPNFLGFVLFTAGPVLFSLGASFTNWDLQHSIPFAFVGLGWQHYQVTNTNTFTSSVARDDDVMAVPVGGGLEYAVGRFMADARFTYRATYYNDLVVSGANLNSWGVATQIGFSF